MREIKFKAYVKHGEYPHRVYWFDVRWGNYRPGDGWIGMLPWGAYEDKGLREQVDPDDCELVAFTNLKDKNGKEIYEGDIVKVVCGCGHYENLPVECKDGYNGYYAKAQWQHDWDNNQLELRWTERDAEIIGNIYENPDRMLF